MREVGLRPGSGGGGLVWMTEPEQEYCEVDSRYACVPSMSSLILVDREFPKLITDNLKVAFLLSCPEGH